MTRTKREHRQANLDKFEQVKKLLLKNHGIASRSFPNTNHYRYSGIMYMGIKNTAIDFYPIGERVFNISSQEWDDCSIEDFYFNITGKKLTQG